MRVRISLGAVVLAAIGAAALVGASSPATASRSGCVGASGNGYTYAGHQATHRGHGVRATVTPLRVPDVAAGHVAGWVGVGGPGQGPDGEDMWMQVGLAAMPGLGLMSYVEITRPRTGSQFVLVEQGLAAGRPHHLAVLEMSGRKGWWRAWVDGRPVSEPMHLPGSSGRWAPIATAESWNGGGGGACNVYAFRFERVSVSYGGGGSWRPLVSAYTFLDSGNRVRRLSAAPAVGGVYARTLASTAQGDRPLPYAFVASSGS